VRTASWGRIANTRRCDRGAPPAGWLYPFSAIDRAAPIMFTSWNAVSFRVGTTEGRKTASFPEIWFQLLKW